MNEHALDLYVEKTNEKIDVSGFTQLYSRSPQRGDSDDSKCLWGHSSFNPGIRYSCLQKVLCRSAPNVHGKWKEKFQKDL